MLSLTGSGCDTGSKTVFDFPFRVSTFRRTEIWKETRSLKVFFFIVCTCIRFRGRFLSKCTTMSSSFNVIIKVIKSTRIKEIKLHPRTKARQRIHTQTTKKTK